MAWARKRARKRKAPVATKAAGAVPLEEDEQAAFISYLHRLPEPWCDTYFAVPNDGRRGWNAQRLFKKLGGRRGVPDLVIPIPVKPYHGLYIEFKRTKGSVTTDEQNWWKARLQAQGYKAEICKGTAEAILLLDTYRNGSGLRWL